MSETDTTFVFRIGEMFQLSEQPYAPKPGDAHLAVALLAAPPFPGESHGKSRNYAVVAAEVYPTKGDSESKWGWVHLAPKTKEAIGYKLEEIEAVPGKWYYMLASFREDF